MELKDNHNLYLWNQRRLELQRLQTEMYLCNQAFEDYPYVVQLKVHKNAIQGSPDNLAEQDARQTLRQSNCARNIGFRDIHDIMKQGPPRRTILKEIHTEDVVNGETVIKVYTGKLNGATAI